MFVKFTTEKGVSAKVRAQMKAQVLAKYKEVIKGAEPNACGGFSIYLADDATNGKPIYAHFSCVISQTDPMEKTIKSKSKTTVNLKEVLATESVLVADFCTVSDTCTESSWLS